MTFYQVVYKEDDSIGTAHTEKGVRVPTEGPVDDWEPVDAVLRDGDFADYLASDLGVRLCSGRMKELLSSLASPADTLQWLPVRVRSKDEARVYFILQFAEPPDILHESTLRAGDFVVKPVIDLAKAKNHSVVSFETSGPTLFITRDVRNALVRAACTGAEFERASTR